MKQATSQLGLAYRWRLRRKQRSEKSLSHEEQGIRLRELERENAELRKANNILEGRA